MKKYLSDFFLFIGLLFLAIGISIEYNIAIALIVCGILIIMMGVKLIPNKGQ